MTSVESVGSVGSGKWEVGSMKLVLCQLYECCEAHSSFPPFACIHTYVHSHHNTTQHNKHVPIRCSVCPTEAAEAAEASLVQTRKAKRKKEKGKREHRTLLDLLRTEYSVALCGGLL